MQRKAFLAALREPEEDRGSEGGEACRQAPRGPRAGCSGARAHFSWQRSGFSVHNPVNRSRWTTRHPSESSFQPFLLERLVHEGPELLVVVDVAGRVSAG